VRYFLGLRGRVALRPEVEPGVTVEPLARSAAPGPAGIGVAFERCEARDHGPTDTFLWAQR
jgi:hypothetical protein